MERKYPSNSVGGLIESLLKNDDHRSALTAAELILARHMYDPLTEQQIHMYQLSFHLLFAHHFPAHDSLVDKAKAIAYGLCSTLNNHDRFSDTHRHRHKRS